MRALSPAPHHVVTLRRGDDEFSVEMQPVPLGFPSALEAAYPPPVVYVNGKPEPDEARRPEYMELRAMVLLAASIVGDFAPATPRPAPSAKRDGWDAYARAVRDEFATAGFVSGDIVQLFEGYARVNDGSGLGKPHRSSATAA